MQCWSTLAAPVRLTQCATAPHPRSAAATRKPHKTQSIQPDVAMQLDVPHAHTSKLGFSARGRPCTSSITSPSGSSRTPSILMRCALESATCRRAWHAAGLTNEELHTC